MNLILLKILAATEKVGVGDGDKQAHIPSANSVDILAGVLNGAYIIAGGFAVIIIILAGFSFMTGSYDQAKITKAKNAILYSVIGLIVIALAFILTQYIIGKLKGVY